MLGLTIVKLNSGHTARWQIRRGQELFAEKQRCIASGQAWRNYVKEQIGLSRERADELIRIGLGLLSVGASRAAKRKSQRASRAKKDRPYAKLLLLNHAARSEKGCASLRGRIGKAHLSQADINEMKQAVGDAIASWEALLREVDARDPVRRLERPSRVLDPDRPVA